MDVILTSAVVATFISSLVSSLIAQRKISIENITQERKKWREQIRTKTLLLHKAVIDDDKVKMSELRTELSLLLNPNDT